MANTKISQLPAATTLTTADLFPVVQGGVTKQVTPDLLPLSTAATTALNGKDAAGAAAAAQAAAVQRVNHTGTQTADTITDGTTNKAYTATEQTKLAGIATAATANRTDSATDAAITAAVNGLVNGAPGALDTLKELADAMADDAAFSVTVTNALALKAPIASPTFTGTVSGVTAAMVGLGNVDNISLAAIPSPQPVVTGWTTIYKPAVDAWNYPDEICFLDPARRRVIVRNRHPTASVKLAYSSSATQNDYNSPADAAYTVSLAPGQEWCDSTGERGLFAKPVVNGDYVLVSIYYEAGAL